MRRCPICKREYPAAGRCPDDGATLVEEDAAADPLIGTVMNGFRIERQLGAGGVGVVYLARQLLLDRPVALKVLRPVPGVSKDDTLHRFLREARLLSSVSHPHVVSVIDFGNTENGTAYLAMEYVPGPSLKAFVEERGGLHLAQIVTIMSQLCAAVHSAHELNIVHRDLKPLNVIVASEREGFERVKLLDFGIGKALGEGTQDFTSTNVVLGTPGYLAPEQIRNAKGVDVRADIYALGAILYFLATGRSPYRGQQPAAIMSHQLTARPEELVAEELHDLAVLVIEPVIRRAMEQEPEARYQTAHELEEALAELGAGADSGQTIMRPNTPAVARTTAPKVETRVDSTFQILPPRRAPRGIAAAVSVLMVLVLMGWWNFGAPQRRAAASITPAENQPIDVRGVSPTTITVGFSAALSGSAAEIGRGMRTGIEVALAAANKRGGVAGRTVQLLALDDGYDPERTRANITELLKKDRVFAFLGNVGTPTTEAVLPQLLESGTLLFGPLTGADTVRKNPPDRYVFNYRPSYSEEAKMLVKHLVEVKHVPAHKIAIFAQDDSFGESGVRGVREALKAYGVAPERIHVVRYERNTRIVEPAAESIVARWREHEIGAVLVAATYGASARLTREIREAGVSIPVANLSFVGSDALAGEFKEVGTQFGAGVIAAQVVPRFDGYSSLAERFRRDLAEFRPDETASSTALEGYVTATIFLEGLRRVGPDITEERLLTKLETMKGFDFGSGAPVNFAPSDHQASHKLWGVELDGAGVWHEIDLS